MLPHEPTFPHRRRIVLAVVAIGALVALAWPGLDLGRRIAAPCAIILVSALAYAFTLGILKLLRFLPRFIFLGYSYVFFFLRQHHLGTAVPVLRLNGTKRNTGAVSV
jgi:hypothetical protein